VSHAKLEKQFFPQLKTSIKGKSVSCETRAAVSADDSYVLRCSFHARKTLSCSLNDRSNLHFQNDEQHSTSSGKCKHTKRIKGKYLIKRLCVMSSRDNHGEGIVAGKVFYKAKEGAKSFAFRVSVKEEAEKVERKSFSQKLFLSLPFLVFFPFETNYKRNKRGSTFSAKSVCSV
jgi:hypothetical protein